MQGWHLFASATAILAVCTFLLCPPAVNASAGAAGEPSPSSTPAPNPAAAASKRRVLIVMGMLEHSVFLSGAPLPDDTIDMANAGEAGNAQETQPAIYVSLLAQAACLDKETFWKGMSEPEKASVREVKVYSKRPGVSSSSST